MIQHNGGDTLRTFTQQSYQPTLTMVVPGIWHVLGHGHSNAIFIEAATSVILIDTLDTLERGQRLKALIQEKTTKPVKTIVYTHCHPDHRGGAGAFLATDPEIIAFGPKTPALERTEHLQDIQNLRGSRQFGYNLTDEEAISQGIGIREGITCGESRAFVPPTTLYTTDRVEREIDGVRLELVRLPGEADDQIMIWLPDHQTLCCGDNYYGCWPNLYAIRGGQYRDLAIWIHSLDTILSYPAQHLLPGHTAVLSGQDIRTVLGNFRNAIDFVLTHTLQGMNAGRSADELAASLHLPPEYADLPYLKEFYGCVDWTVRAVYGAYLGWFDGNPTRLHPLPPQKHAARTVALMGGREAVQHAAQRAVQTAEDAEDVQWCLELCDLLLALDNTAAIRLLKAAALEKLAEYETSANGRHYYLACARELQRG